MRRCTLLRALTAALAVTVAGRAGAQFVERFDSPGDLAAWECLTGDGEATMKLVAGDGPFASIVVDATRDRRNVWWALVKRQVSERLDLAAASRPDRELRIAARVRASDAPRRVNLHLNTQRTTDFHSHLMEFDLAEAGRWYTISMTTRDFDVRPGDTVNGQLALMDWGLGRYRLDVDDLTVDVVDPERAGPDLGEPLPYHPPVRDAATFAQRVTVAHDAVIDLANPGAALGGWSFLDAGATRRVLTAGGTQWVVMRFDLGAYAGKRVVGAGLLEMTTHSLLRSTDERKDFGLLRVAEIVGGDPSWRQETVTADGLRRGEPLERVVDPQPIIDWQVSPGDGSRTRFTISRPVLQRLIDGRALGLAIVPLGAIVATFYAVEHDGGRLAARLLFDTEE